jgi:hypothetical protein
MKKKLKVKKAFAGKMMKAAPAQARRVIAPQRPILGRPPTRRLIPSTVVNPVRPGMQPSSQIDPNSPRSLPFASAVGPQQPLSNIQNILSGSGTGGGKPLQPLPSPIIDRRQQPNPSGNIFGIMSQRPPQSQQPVQPVPAMKKGGIVRGGRAETKGTRPAKLY